MSEPTARVTAEDVQAIEEAIKVAEHAVEVLAVRRSKIWTDLDAALTAVSPIVARLEQEIGQCRD